VCVTYIYSIYIQTESTIACRTTYCMVFRPIRTLFRGSSSFTGTETTIGGSRIVSSIRSRIVSKINLTAAIAYSVVCV
jgi:hypothetical protein